MLPVGSFSPFGGGGAVGVDGRMLVLGSGDHQSVSVRAVALQRRRPRSSRSSFTFAFGRSLRARQ